MNYFSKTYFLKDLYEIIEKDVICFFQNNQFETTYLEFKSGEVSLEKIYKEVVALHNSEGGLIIIGSPKPTKDKEGNEFFEGELTYSIHKNKDWLYQKICGKISPMPVGIKIHDVKCLNGKIIQILDIPKSVNPPHQCLDDGVYYLRFETQTRFAPHSFVEALFNRRKSTSIEFENFNIGTILRDNSFFTSVSVSNHSEIPIIGLDYIIEFLNINNLLDIDNDNIIGKDLNYYKDMRIITANKSISNDFTLVKGLGVKFEYKIDHFNEAFIPRVNIYGKNLGLKTISFIVCPVNKVYREILEDGENIYQIFISNIEDILAKRSELNEEPFIKLLEKLKKF
jgi:hypothetical protein